MNERAKQTHRHYYTSPGAVLDSETMHNFALAAASNSNCFLCCGEILSSIADDSSAVSMINDHHVGKVLVRHIVITAIALNATSLLPCCCCYLTAAARL